MRKVNVIYYHQPSPYAPTEEALMQSYFDLMDKGSDVPHLAYSSTEIPVKGIKSEKIKFPNTVIFTDTDTGKEINRLECIFTIGEFQEMATNIETAKKKFPINKNNYRCYLTKNGWVVLAVVLLMIGGVVGAKKLTYKLNQAKN